VPIYRLKELLLLLGMLLLEVLFRLLSLLLLLLLLPLEAAELLLPERR